MPSFIHNVERRKALAREIIKGLHLTQDAYRAIIADIDALNDWDENPVSNGIVRSFNSLFSSLADSDYEDGRNPVRSSSELFHKMFVIWAMQDNSKRIAGLPYSIYIRGRGRPWWNDAMTEFLAMVRGHDVDIDWLDNFFQQFADEPPSKTNKRRQITKVAPADQPRLLRRTLVAAPQAAEETPSSLKVAKRKQDSQMASDKSAKASSSSPSQPMKKIKPNTPEPSSRFNVISGISSRGIDHNPPLRTSQHALSTANFGLGLPNNLNGSNVSPAAQPERALVGHPQTDPSPAQDPTSSIDWHPEHIKMKKERDDLASQLQEANEQLKEKETRLSELHTQLSPLMDSAHGMLQGLNAVDLQREKLREAAIKLLSHTSCAPEQAATAPGLNDRGDAAPTTEKPEPKGQSLAENGSDATKKVRRHKTD